MWKQSLVAVYTLILVTFLASCSGSSDNGSVDVEPPVAPVIKTNAQYIDELWPTTISQLVNDSLWLDRDKYDAANILMQPMQYAFLSKQSAKQAEFRDFFTRLNNYFEESISDNRVSTTQFMYFVSEYLVLEQAETGLNQELLSLHQKLQTWLVDFIYSSAWMYGREPFDDLLQRLQWKLSNKQVDFSYYRAMFDEDLHSLATLANLVFLAQKLPAQPQESRFLVLKQQALPLLEQMLKQEIQHTEQVEVQGNYWLFQPGVWTDHPQYAYAGNDQLAQSIAVKPVQNIATDSSHMHRWPLWLQAYKRAFADEQAMTSYLSESQRQLAQQFNNKVYVKPDAEFTKSRVNNFFNGFNGVYGYKATTKQGYGPYQLSGILFSGWYGNLQSAAQWQNDLKVQLAQDTSLTTSELTTYVGPNTSRQRHPMFTWPEYFNSDLAKLNLRVSLALLEQR